MERCLTSSRVLFDKWFGLIIFLASGTFLIVTGSICLNPASMVAVVLCGFLCVLGLALVGAGVFQFVVQSRKFSLDSKGITLCYLGNWRKTYSWQSVTEISACDVNHAAKDHTQFDLVIRILIGEEKKNENLLSAASGIENWRSGIYGLTHFKNVIMLTYDQERQLQVEALSGIPVRDLRTKVAK